MAPLFTDLVGFSAWALHAGDAAVLELLREVGAEVEALITGHEGRIVKRLGDGLMATFLSARKRSRPHSTRRTRCAASSSTATRRACAPASTGAVPRSWAVTI